MVFVTQVCHYIDSLIQRWGFAWSAYYIDQETTVQLAAGVGSYNPVSTCVYSSLLFYSKVQVAGLDDHAMSFIGPLKCERHRPQRICKSKRCNSSMYRLSKSVTTLEEQRFNFRHTKRDHEELQQALQDEQIWVHKKANGFSVQRTKDKKKHLSQEEMDNPPKSLAAAKASIASKDAKLIEIEIELDRIKTSIEDLKHKHLKLEQELEMVLLILDDAEKHKAKMYVKPPT